MLTQYNVLINREQILANSLISHAYTSVIWNNVFVSTKVSFLLESLMTVSKRWYFSISPIFEKCTDITFLNRRLVSLFNFIEWKPNIVHNSYDCFSHFSLFYSSHCAPLIILIILITLILLHHKYLFTFLPFSKIFISIIIHCWINFKTLIYKYFNKMLK